MKAVSRILISVLCAVAQPVLAGNIEIVPNILSVGKENTVQLKSKQTIKHAALIPSGPQSVQSLPLPDDESAPHRAEAMLNDIKLSVSQSNELQLNENGQLIGKYRSAMPILDVTTIGSLAVLANDKNGVTVLDVSDAKSPVWKGSHQKLGRIMRVIPAAEKQVLALNDADVLYVLDLKNPQEPTVINMWRSPTPIRHITWSGQQASVWSDANIHVIDFSAPIPQLGNEGFNFGQGVNYGGQRRVDIVGNIAYVADWFSGIHLYDISNPSVPILLSSFHTPGSPKGMLVRDNIAYVPDDDHGLQIIDVKNPLAPRQIAHIQTNGLGYTPKIVGNTLYLASHRGGFQIIDITNPAKPSILSDIDTPGKAWSLAVQDEKMYVADDDTGLLIFDVRNSKSPKQIGQFKPPKSGTTAEEVLVRGNTAFVAFFDDGLYILDISQPSQPKIISHTPLAGNTRGLDLVGDKLYVASWLAGVHVLDVKDLAKPQILSHYDTRGATWGLKAVGGYLYTMDWWGGLSVLDVSNPNEPYMVGDYNHRGFVNDLAMQGNYAFVAQGSNGLQVFEISNPTNPTWVTGINFLGDARRIVLNKYQAYLAMGDAGLAIADISEPFRTNAISSISTSGKVVDVAVAKNYAWLLDKVQGVLLYDVAKPTHPRALARINQKVNALAASGNSVIVATGETLSRYEVDANGKVQLQVERPMNSPVQKLVWQGNALYVASKDGLQLFEPSSLSLKKSNHIGSNVMSLSAKDKHLFASSEYEVVQLDAETLNVLNRYPQLSKVAAVTSHNGAIYMSGNATINAQKLLPELQVKENSITLPATAAIGQYDMLVTFEDGKQQRINNALKIELPKFSKPKMTIEEFKALYEQQKGK